LKTYYDILGVSKEATYSEIRNAYRKLAKEFHPDNFVKNNDSLFKEIQEAWEVLKDDEKRRDYDNTVYRKEQFSSNSSSNSFKTKNEVDYNWYLEFLNRINNPATAKEVNEHFEKNESNYTKFRRLHYKYSGELLPEYQKIYKNYDEFYTSVMNQLNGTQTQKDVINKRFAKDKIFYNRFKEFHLQYTKEDLGSWEKRFKKTSWITIVIAIIIVFCVIIGSVNKTNNTSSTTNNTTTTPKQYYICTYNDHNGYYDICEMQGFTTYNLCTNYGNNKPYILKERFTCLLKEDWYK